MKEKLQDLILDWFIESWKDKTFPVDLKIKTYEDARIFREFWLSHCELDLQPAINYFLAKKGEKTTL